MNSDCPLYVVEQEIERMVRERPDKPSNGRDLYDAFEDAAIVVLDSRWEEFPPGILQSHLASYLYCQQKMIGIADTL